MNETELLVAELAMRSAEERHARVNLTLQRLAKDAQKEHDFIADALQEDLRKLADLLGLEMPEGSTLRFTGEELEIE